MKIRKSTRVVSFTMPQIEWLEAKSTKNQVPLSETVRTLIAGLIEAEEKEANRRGPGRPRMKTDALIESQEIQFVFFPPAPSGVGPSWVPDFKIQVYMKNPFTGWMYKWVPAEGYKECDEKGELLNVTNVR